ncbi:MAG: NAD-dependent epimerase/dehydratase family protein [Lachnospiraceae bacterium]|nr:NAD-dependent epimerase/dehydratase family protein [Lachnospiraceae bacterium]
MYNRFDPDNTVLITGAAGFIGFHLSKLLLSEGATVVGIDNMNDYYDVGLKESRLQILNGYERFSFVKGSISDAGLVNHVFEDWRPDIVVNLAAQAGVRYSIDNPASYIDSNIVGFFNILEACRHSYDGREGVKHLVFASSSSIYGNQMKTPFSVSDRVDHPISLYAATKKSNELMGYSYCHLYGIPMTGVRFFTVYGPYGRPDMAYFKFANKMKMGEPIQIYNNGDMLRDFTYVDDIVTGLEHMLCNPPAGDEESGGDPFKVYNIGNNKPEKLLDFIDILEDKLGMKAVREYLPMQPGDVYQTYADVDDLVRDFDFKPETPLAVGLERFAEWYKEYYK